jgi:hypothetical protein
VGVPRKNNTIVDKESKALSTQQKQPSLPVLGNHINCPEPGLKDQHIYFSGSILILSDPSLILSRKSPLRTVNLGDSVKELQ